MAAEPCGKCGVPTVRAARFCHRCGAPLDEVDVELDVFSATQMPVTAPAPYPPSGSRLAPLLFGVVAVIGVLAVVLFTPDGDGEAPADPPTPSVEAPADPPTSSVEEGSEDPAVSSEPVASDRAELVAISGLNWTPGPEFGEVWPLAFVEYDGSVFFFASGPISPFGIKGEGLWAWRSSDRRSWSPLGAVIDSANTVNAVIADSDGLIAVGVDGAKAPVVWSSIDGLGWEVRPLPLDTVPGGASVQPTAIASSGDLTVIVGTLDGLDLDDLVGQAVAELLDKDLAEYNVEANAPFSVTVRGPLGLELAEYTAAELGLSETELADLEGLRRAPVTVVWSSTDGGDWRTTNLDEYYAASVVAATDGGVVITGSAAGFGPRAQGALVSVDGLEWTLKSNAPGGPVVQWGAAIVGVANDGTRLRVSTTGADWDTIALGELFPEGPGWSVSRVAADDQGIAVLARGFDGVEPVPATSAAIVKDGFTLTSDSGEIVVREGGTERLRVRAYLPADGSYRVNLVEGIVVFFDPETSEPLVTVTIDELRELEQLAGAGLGAELHQLILTSVDAQTWNLSDVSEFADDTTFVGALGVTDATVVAAVATVSSPSAWQVETPTIQLFTADLVP